MSTLYHIAGRAAWAAAQAAGVYQGDTLAGQGFTHLSLAHQVLRVANALYRGRSDLVLLVIESDRLSSELRFEAGEPGEDFPHLYGPLNLAAVRAVYDFPPLADGSFQLPEGAA